MATIKATKKRVENFPNLKFKRLGKTRFLTSICGFGCYRLDESIAEHHKALEFVLAREINLIDTSANYTDGGSEKLIGNVLQNAFQKGDFLPDEIIIVSKGGYIQGNNLKSAKEKEEAGNP